MPWLDPSTHDDNISITINLAALSSGVQGFMPLIIGKDITLPGEARVVSYSTVAQAEADRALTHLDDLTLDCVREMLGQRPRPEFVRVGRWDAGGPEAIGAAIDAIAAVTTDFYGVAVASRAAADLVALGAKITSLESDGTKLLAVVQSSVADLLTADLPAALSDLEGHERVALVYHSDDDGPRAEGWLGNRLAYDPDEVSVPWHAPVREVFSFDRDAVTQAQKEAARGNHVNLALPFGTRFPAYVDTGRTLAGRPVDQIVTADWFEVRLREGMADLIATMSDNGEKLGINADGQNRLAGVFNAVARRGVGAQHFEDGQTLIEPLAITQADRDAGRLRFSSGAQHVVAARGVDITVNLSTSPVVE